MTIEEIMGYLPHRYPILMVDRILALVPGKSCTGLKNVSINESMFQGHYPGKPIMPGVMIVEAMAQAGAIILLSEPSHAGMIPIIAGIENIKFRKAVVPGDQLISTIEVLWFRRKMGKMRAFATVSGELVASMEMTFIVTHAEDL